MVTSWMTCKLKLKCCVCQLLLQIHFEWVWTLLLNRSKKQSRSCLTTQKKNIKNISTSVKQNQSKTKTKLTFNLLTKTLKVTKFLLKQKEQCITQGSTTQKFWLSTSLQWSHLKSLKQCSQSHVNILCRMCKCKWKSTQKLHTWSTILWTHVCLLSFKGMLTQSVLKLSIPTLTEKQTSHRKMKKQSQT